MTQLTALQAVQAAAAQAAAVASVDMTETSSGGGEGRRILETGKYMARFCEYIEKGTQKNFHDAAKPPRPVAELRFAVFPIDEVDGVRKAGAPVFLTSFDQTISNHEKATMKAIYNKLNFRKDASKTHVAMFLGNAYMLDVVKYKNKAGKDANKLELKTLSPAIDPISGGEYPVPVLDDKYYRAFFWDLPTKASWDSLHIEGAFDNGDSKNFIQEGILQAVDFPGSALEQLLGGAPSVAEGMLDTSELPAAPQGEEAAPCQEPVGQGLPEQNVAPAAPQMPVMPDLPNLPSLPEA